MEKPLNEYTIKEFREIPYSKYNGDYITDIILVPVERRHQSKYRCMKYILLSNFSRDICGVLGGGSDILQLQRITERDTYRIDCLYRSKCFRIMFSPMIKLTEYDVTFGSEFHIGGIIW